MKIKLLSPFKQKYRMGYIVINNENRKNVILFNNKKDRTTISYARYLMSVKLKRFLNKNEEVDHIDNNKTNDRLNNLQLLTPIQNRNKTAKGQTKLKFICPVCKKKFKLTLRQSHRENPCCSRTCGGIKSHW